MSAVYQSFGSSVAHGGNYLEGANLKSVQLSFFSFFTVICFMTAFLIPVSVIALHVINPPQLGKMKMQSLLRSSFYHPREECRDSIRSRHQRGGVRPEVTRGFCSSPIKQGLSCDRMMTHMKTHTWILQFQVLLCVFLHMSHCAQFIWKT